MQADHRHHIRPDTFEAGGEYLRAERLRAPLASAFIPVRFVAYDPCPAFVIVRGPDGVRRRCPRAELYAR